MAHAQEKARDGHAGAAGDVPAQQHAEIPGGDPGQHRRQRRCVDGGHKPADVIGIAATHRSLGIVHQAVDLFISGGHRGKHIGTDDHDRTHDQPGQDAQRHVAAGLFQDSLRLEKDAGADDDADHHADGGRQAVFFLQSIFHFDIPSPVF